MCQYVFGFANIELGALLDYEQPQKYIVKNTDYKSGFETPVLTAGKTFLIRMTNESHGICEASAENPVILFDDFTGDIRWVDFPFKVKSSAIKILRSQHGKQTLRFAYHTMMRMNRSISQHSRLWISKLSKVSIPVPNLKKLQEIVSSLDKFENLCSNLSSGLPAEITARKGQYEHYRDKLLTLPSAN